ncbi:MAG: hypothetical protein ACJ72D_31210 [Marmoricola sp.]
MAEQIVLQWEYRADFPLWTADDDHPTSEDDWPTLSPDLIDELHEWCEFNDLHIEEREPWHGTNDAGAVSWEQTVRRVETEGVRLAARVQAELGSGYVVAFRSA